MKQLQTTSVQLCSPEGAVQIFLQIFFHHCNKLSICTPTGFPALVVECQLLTVVINRKTNDFASTLHTIQVSLNRLERIKAIEIFSFDNIFANRKKRLPNNAKGTEYKTYKNHENQRKKLGSNHSLMVFVVRKTSKITTAIRMMEKNQQLLNEVYIQKT